MSVYLTIMGNMPDEASTVVRAKIGCTEVNAESRAAALQTGNPEKLHVFHEVLLLLIRALLISTPSLGSLSYLTSDR